MYDIKKRSYFTTLGELRMLLKDYPDETTVYNCGCEDSWLHIDADEKFISLDNESLTFDYCTDLKNCGISDSDEMDEYYEFQQRKAHEERLEIAHYECLAMGQDASLDCIDY